jgi:hypothetical protein
VSHIHNDRRTEVFASARNQNPCCPDHSHWPIFWPHDSPHLSKPRYSRVPHQTTHTSTILRLPILGGTYSSDSTSSSLFVQKQLPASMQIQRHCVLTYTSVLRGRVYVGTAAQHGNHYCTDLAHTYNLGSFGAMCDCVLI